MYVAPLAIITHRTLFLVKLVLDVRYPDDYPEVLPELTINPSEGDLEDEEVEHLLKELQTVVINDYMNAPESGSN